MAGTKSTAERARRAGGKAPRTGTVQSLVRSISILNALAKEEHGLTLTDLAQKIGLAPSTAHRLLTTLQQERFVRFDQDRSVWLIGVQAFVVGNAFVRSRDVLTMSRPYMRRLMEESGETVNLAVEDQGEAVYLAQVECRQMMRAIAKPGGRVPLHCSGIGKALLASMPDREVAKILRRRGLERMTDKTIDTPARLRDSLTRIRSLGYAFDDEENAIGLRCVAAVVHDEYGEPLAGLSLSGPMARIPDDRMPLLGGIVSKTAAAITAALGGRTPMKAAS